MSVWYGWPGDKVETYNIKASDVNMNLNTGNIFNGSITTTFKKSNFICDYDTPVSTFRDTATFTINPYDKKHAPDDILPGIRPGSFGEDEGADFQAKLVEKLNDKEFQAAARQRYQIMAGIIKNDDDLKNIMSMKESAAYFNGVSLHVELNPKTDFEMLKKIKDKDAGYIMSKGESAAYFRSLPDVTEDDSCDSVELPTRRAGKTIKELTQEVQYDLEREHDVKKREELIMRCARYIRLERMSESLNDLT